MSQQNNLSTLQQSLTPLFPPRSPAPANLTALLDPNYSLYTPLNLDNIHTTHAHVLAHALPYTQAANTTEVWNETYNARVFPADSICDPPVLFLRALLVGVLDGDAKGALRLTTLSFPIGAQIVIAPPPGPDLHGRPVWIRDWRYVPSRLFAADHHSEGVFEVLQKDVVPLTSRDDGNECVWVRLAPAMELDPRKSVSVCGTVQAKSCVVASSKSSVCFFVEMVEETADAERIAAMIVFRGSDAVKWWPFLLIGRQIGVTGLTLSTLPRLGHKMVFKASGSHICVQEVSCEAGRTNFQNASAPLTDRGTQSVRKRPRFNLQPLDDPCRKRRNGSREESMKKSLITFEGEITNVLADGRFELDGKVVLHLGGFNGSCAGPGVTSLCFRRGARIEAFWVLAVSRPNHRVSLFPTGRTSLNILYFGALKASISSGSLVRWEHTPWLWLWKRWDYLDVLWAEDVFESLAVKFKPWLTNENTFDESQSIQDENIELTRYLLGSRKATGLVQFTMHVLSSRQDLLETRLAPARNVYTEFVNPLSFASKDLNGSFPKLPSIKHINGCIKLLWKDETSKRISKYESMYHSPSTSITCIFQASDLSVLYLREKKERVKKHQSVQKVSLIGLLQGSSSADGQLVFSDSTGSIQVQATGLVQPYILGAIICINRFSFVVESSQLHRATQTTLVFDPSDASIVVDGPCVEMKRNEKGSGSSRVDGKNSLRHATQSHAIFSRRLTQSMSQSLKSSKPGSQVHPETLVVDAPLICIFIERVMKGKRELKVTGHLIAVSQSRRENEWEALNDRRGGFWQCSLSLSGDCALQLCPALQEHNLYSISCTELIGVRQPAACLLKRAKSQPHEGYVLELNTSLHSVFPWIENLGRGFYMRFKSTRMRDQHDDDDPGRNGVSGVSAEGEQYMHVLDAVEAFRSQAVSVVQKSLWKTNSWIGISEVQKDQVMSIRGIVEDFTEIREGHVNSNLDYNIVAKLVVRDEIVSSFTVTILFFNGETKPRGIAPGMKVIAHNVVRVPRKVYRRFDFVGNAGTTVRVVSYEPAAQLQTNCRRCTIPNVLLQSLQKELPTKCMWDFSYPREAESQQSCSAGIVRFKILRIKQLQVGLSDDSLDCNFCAIPDQFSEKWNIGMSVVVVVDDGTADGEMRCKGFRRCTQLLRATEQECRALKGVALAFKTFEIDAVSAAAAQRNFSVREAGEVGENLLAVYNLMCKDRGASNVAIVLNQTSIQPTLPREIEIDEIDGKVVWLGFGRKLCTSTAPCFKVVLECMNVMCECNCIQAYACNCREKGLMKPIDTLRFLMSAEQSMCRYGAK